jgi:hypothetical protein
MLYYLSDRDDHTCIWAQPLDPVTKEPNEDPFAVVHAHTSSMKMLYVQRGVWSLEVGSDRLVFNASSLASEIYTAVLRSR